MGATRMVVMAVMQSGGSSPRQVEFTLDDAVAERLRQLRSLVPPATGLRLQRDLVIDKVRARLATAVWRRLGEPVTVSGSCIVVSSDGVFHCGAKELRSQAKLLSCTFPIERLVDLHAQRPDGEIFVIRDGRLLNDEPAEADAQQRLLQFAHTEPPRPLESASDFDTLQGLPLQASALVMAPQAGAPARRTLN